MREHADVTAAGDRYSCVECRLEGRALALDVGAAGDRQGRTKRDTTFFHQAKYFRRAAIAVLDRFNSSERRAAHSFRCRRMCAHGNVGTLRCFDDELELVE